MTRRSSLPLCIMKNHADQQTSPASHICLLTPGRVGLEDRSPTGVAYPGSPGAGAVSRRRFCRCRGRTPGHLLLSLCRQPVFLKPAVGLGRDRQLDQLPIHKVSDALLEVSGPVSISCNVQEFPPGSFARSACGKNGQLPFGQFDLGLDLGLFGRRLGATLPRRDRS